MYVCVKLARHCNIHEQIIKLSSDAEVQNTRLNQVKLECQQAKQDCEAMKEVYMYVYVFTPLSQYIQCACIQDYTCVHIYIHSRVYPKMSASLILSVQHCIIVIQHSLIFYVDQQGATVSEGAARPQVEPPVRGE